MNALNTAIRGVAVPCYTDYLPEEDTLDFAVDLESDLYRSVMETLHATLYHTREDMPIALRKY